MTFDERDRLAMVSIPALERPSYASFRSTTIKANLAIIGRLTPILWTTNSEPKRKVVTYVFA
jgi:hypothetical protein